MNLISLKLEMIAEALRQDPEAKPVGTRKSFDDSFSIHMGRYCLWWNDSVIDSTYLATRPIPEGV